MAFCFWKRVWEDNSWFLYTAPIGRRKGHELVLWLFRINDHCFWLKTNDGNVKTWQWYPCKWNNTFVCKFLRNYLDNLKSMSSERISMKFYIVVTKTNEKVSSHTNLPSFIFQQNGGLSKTLDREFVQFTEKRLKRFSLHC